TLDARSALQLQVIENHSPLGPERVDDQQPQTRLEQLAAHAVRARGTGHCRHMAPGYRWRLRTDVQGVTDPEQDYEVPRVGRAGPRYGAVERLLFRDRVECTPATVPYRPGMKGKTRREIVASATVVGPSGHDVFTDKVGRVKVQCHWDAAGGMNYKSWWW